MTVPLTGPVAVPELADVADHALLEELLGAGHAPDPYPTYRRIQHDWPVWRHYGAVGLMRYDDIQTVLRHPQISADDRKSRQHSSMAAERKLGPGYLSQLDRRSFLHRDPPDHTRLRRLVSKAFTPRRVEQLRPFVQRYVNEVLASTGRAHRIELIGDLAYPLPIAVICRLLGVPAEDRAIVESWPRAQLCCSFEPAGLAAEADARDGCQVEADRIQQQLGEYFDDLVARRRAAPRDDLVSALVAAGEQEERLSADELNATLRLLFVGGYETTVNLIGNAVLALARHPDQLRAVRDNPALAGAAVEETLRYDAPFQFTRRVALADIDIGGYRIPEGSVMLLMLAAANRDPARFTDPDGFDIARSDNRHLGFGAGIHACLGGPLARMQGEVVIATLARALVDPALETDPPPYRRDAFRAIETLPVSFRRLAPQMPRIACAVAK